MSSNAFARRAYAVISVDGIDITDDLQPYFLQLIYTDNEEDSTDDLQIRLQDREGIWMQKWLAKTIDASATLTDEGGIVAGDAYKVTPAVGLNVRSGPGTSYSKLGALVCGTVIAVSKIENDWAKITYDGKDAYVSANYITPTDEKPESGGGENAANTPALKIRASIVRENWASDGKDDVLDCGQFELDSIVADGPPATVTIKSTSLPYTAKIRQTERTKAWEAYSLSGIASEMATSNGMKMLYLSGTVPYYERTEQFQESDISFLSRLCHNAGISLKATSNMLVLFDQSEYENADPVLTIRPVDQAYSKYRMSTGKAQTAYATCRVSYTDPATGKCIEGIATAEDYREDSEDNQQLEITAKVSSIGEAQSLARKLLRLHNKFAITASFTLPGDPRLVAGVTVQLAGWGVFDGKYIISQAKHTLSSNYTTQITLRRALEGY